jgi:serine/threonine-protein kinase
MICPRCSVAEISPDTNRCVLCGYTAGPQATVALKEAPPTPTPSAAAPQGASTGGEGRIDSTVKEELGELFHIERALESVGFVLTFIAREAETERKVVLRVLPRQPIREAGLEDKLLRELATAASLDHPHVIPIYRYGATGRYMWYSAKHVPGQSLAELLHASGPIELPALLRIVEQVASALQYAHRRGVVHADVRPAHVRVDPNGWSLLTGFVVGRALDHLPLTALGGRPLRRPEYLAPEERYSRQPGPAADQFSLAVLVFECLTGQSPFVGMGPDDVIPPALANPRPDLPEHVREALRRALSQRPGERFQSILDFVSVLEMDPTPRGSQAHVAGPAMGGGGGPRQLPPARPPRAAQAPQQPSPSRPSRRPVPGPTPGPAPPRASGSTPVLLVEEGSGFRSALKWSLIVGLIVAGGVFGPTWLEKFRERGSPAIPDEAAAPDLVERDSGLLSVRDSAPAPLAALPPVDAPVDSPADSVVDLRETSPEPRPAPPPARPAPIRPQPLRPRTTGPSAQAAGPNTAPGRLFVNSTPWGQLYIDGQLVGNTPQANLVVPAGSHRVRVVREGFQPFERVVQLAPGQEIRITDIALPATNP